MNYKDVLINAKSCIGQYCKACVECNGKADFRFKDREGNITQQAECNKSRD